MAYLDSIVSTVYGPLSTAQSKPWAQTGMTQKSLKAYIWNVNE